MCKCPSVQSHRVHRSDTQRLMLLYLLIAPQKVLQIRAWRDDRFIGTVRMQACIELSGSCWTCTCSVKKAASKWQLLRMPTALKQLPASVQHGVTGSMWMMAHYSF